MTSEQFQVAVRPALDQWIKAGSPAQQGFKWDNRKQTWKSTFPEHADFLAGLPRLIDRTFVRQVMKSGSTTNREKLLTIMLWGFAGIGYGAFRTKRMLDSSQSDLIFEQLKKPIAADDYRCAYEYLTSARVPQLGPSYATKLLAFAFDENPGTPILDSVIANYLDGQNVVEFQGGARKIESWNSTLYEFYVREMRLIARRNNISALDVELAIYNFA